MACGILMASCSSAISSKHTGPLAKKEIRLVVRDLYGIPERAFAWRLR